MELPNKFFVVDKNEMVLLVTRDFYSWWIQIDYTHEDYDCWSDTSGTIANEDLISSVKTGEFQIIPDNGGWVDLEEVDYEEWERLI